MCDGSVSLQRQVSDSDEVRSGQGIVEQPESSQFQLDPDHVVRVLYEYINVP